jgi:hypothetical protein
MALRLTDTCLKTAFNNITILNKDVQFWIPGEWNIQCGNLLGSLTVTETWSMEGQRNIIGRVAALASYVDCLCVFFWCELLFADATKDDKILLDIHRIRLKSNGPYNLNRLFTYRQTPIKSDEEVLMFFCIIRKIPFHSRKGTVWAGWGSS